MKKITLTIIIVLTAFSINAQTLITGTISDITGPLPFANVIISGTNSGTVADAKGYFSIETKKGDILIISYVGYTPKQISIDNTKHLNISLEMDSLDEVVIIGYGTYSSSHLICCGGHTIYCEFPDSHTNERISYTSNESIIKTYPNPTSTGYITLDMKEQYSTVEISIHSITGQRLTYQTYNQPKERLSIDLSKFSKGIYLINMVADGESLPAQKVIRN